MRRLLICLLLLLALTACAQAAVLVPVSPAPTAALASPSDLPSGTGGILHMDHWAAEALRDQQARLPGPAVWTADEKARVRASGSVQRNIYLDTALRMVEAGNPFLERYNLITGADVTPLFDYGVPYFFGGSGFEMLTSRYPEYLLYYSWQDSLYYRENVLYFYGYDCNGFTRWVWQEAGHGSHGALSQMLFEQPERHLFEGHGATPQDWPQVARDVEPGDLLVITHPGYHVAMYLGTLRAFGYTAEEVPELADYLDYPLMIHSGVNAAYADRFTYLQQIGPPRYSLAEVTDGGVTVSLLGVEKTDAPHLVHKQQQDTAYFTLPDGTWLTVLGWGDVRQWCWFR